MFSNNQTSGSSKNIAQLMFLNEAIVAAEKRVAQILVTTGGTTDSGKMYFRVFNGGSPTNALIINRFGTVTVGDGLTFPDGETQETAFMGATGGGSGNTATGTDATVGGGLDNTVTDAYGTIGGGYDNQAGDNAGTTEDAMYATVGGGIDNTASDHYATVGGGFGNTASDWNATVAGGTSNVASGSGSTVGGGWYNTASDFRATIGGGDDNLASGWYATVGGGSNNDAQARYATIAGGGPTDPGNPTTTNNVVTDNYGTIGGGGGNQAGSVGGTRADAQHATVGGGNTNTASAESATVGGGSNNDAQAKYATIAGGGPTDPVSNPTTTNNLVTDDYGTIGGGGGNQAGDDAGTTTDATYATVGGGFSNTASGLYATVPGGFQNTASGVFSCAAGRDATASHSYSFVWGDDNGGTSAANNTFNIHASGGVYVNGALHVASDRNKKENFEPVDSRAVLAKVAAMPMSTWNYKTEDGKYRHMGPMGQDFRAAFGLGTDEKHITTVDADGVALAAIQGLNQRMNEVVQEKDAEIGLLRRQNSALEARLAALEEAISKE
jgi:hypothetical protein